jgi:hypothetical protein
MSNSWSRCSVTGVWTTATLVVLCSALNFRTAQAEEIFREDLDSSTSSVSPTVLPTNEPGGMGASDNERSSDKEKKHGLAASSGSATQTSDFANAVAKPGAAILPDTPQRTDSRQPLRPPEIPVVVQSDTVSGAPVPMPNATPDVALGTESAQLPIVIESPSAPVTTGGTKPEGQSPVTSDPIVNDLVKAADEAVEESSSKPSAPALANPAILPDPAIADPVGGAPVETEVAEEPWSAERTIELLTERAIAHGSSPNEVLAVARCETGYTFMPWRENGNLRRGSMGEVGVGQWLPPVERNHWGRTPHWLEHQYHIMAAYVNGDPDAIWWDADALAWSMGPAAPRGFKSGWSCWRIRGPWWFM